MNGYISKFGHDFMKVLTCKTNNLVQSSEITHFVS